VKGIVEGLFNYLNLPLAFKQDKLDDLHPGRSATLYVDDQLIGFIGQLHPSLAKKMDLKDTYVFDLNLEVVFSLYSHTTAYEKIPKYPSITRDVAFVVNKNVLANDIKMTIETSDAAYVKEVEIFDVYIGENLPNDKKSIAYSIHFQHPDQTLTDKAVDQSFDKIVELISHTYDASIRSS